MIYWLVGIWFVVSIAILMVYSGIHNHKMPKTWQTIVVMVVCLPGTYTFMLLALLVSVWKKLDKPLPWTKGDGDE